MFLLRLCFVSRSRQDLWVGRVGSGTAEDTEYNYNIAKANNSGHFAERRRYVYNTYKLAESAHQNGEVSSENFEKVTQLLKEKLERINEEEREAYQPENNEALQELRNDLETRVDAQNEKRTYQTIKNIENAGHRRDFADQSRYRALQC